MKVRPRKVKYVARSKPQQSGSRSCTINHYTMLQNEENINSLICCLRYIHAEFYSIWGSNAQPMLLTFPHHVILGLLQVLGPSCLLQGKPSMGN